MAATVRLRPYGLWREGPDHLGWRFTDAWLSMAGAGDKGLPNGTPVDEWGMGLMAARLWGHVCRAGVPPLARLRYIPSPNMSIG